MKKVISFSIMALILSTIAGFMPMQQASASVPTNGLVAEWKFEDNALDTSGNNHDGTLVNGASFDDGIVGRGVRIDGATGYVTVPYSPQFDLTSAGTISIWHKLTTSQPEFPALISRGENADTNNNFEIYIHDDGYSPVISNGQGQFCGGGSPAFLDNQWHHVTFTWDGSNCKFYVDGVLITQFAQTFTPAVVGTPPVVIGALTVTDSRVHLNGILDQIRIYNRALSASEVQDLFNEAPSVPTSNLVAEWKFEDNALDTSGNSHDGTLVAGASFDAGIVGRGLRIDGSTGYVTIPYSPQFDLPTAGTVSVWHKLSPSQPQFPALISRGENGDTDNNFEIYLNPVDSPTYRYAAHISNGQSQFCSVTDPALLDDLWHHVVLMWDGTSCKLFLDGVLKSQEPQTITPTLIGSKPVVIGAAAVTDSRVHPNGVLDQIRIYDRALSESEVQSLFNESGQHTIVANKDSYLRQVSDDSNQGANPLLQIKTDATNRVVIAFDESSIASAAEGRTLQSATLRLHINDMGNNWKTTGRTVEVHRLLSDWVEGNGWSVGNNIRGTGTGVTWNCAADTNIENTGRDCDTTWNGGNFVSEPTDSALVKNGMAGQWIEFDVTSDVYAFLSGTPNDGWIIKKTNENQDGTARFDSREAATNNPELVLVFE